MTNPSTALSKSFFFTLLRVLFCFLSVQICNASDFTHSDLGSVTLDPSTREFILQGEAGRFSLNSAGDIDNDGFEDFIIDVFDKGAIYVIYGRESSPSFDHNLNLGSLDPTKTGFKVTGDAIGYSTKAAGDVNKDGYDDILIETSSNTYVIYGGERSSMSHIDLRTAREDPEITGNVSDFIANSSNGGIVIHGNCSIINCNKCNSPFSCSECTAPYLLYKHQCVQSCPERSLPSDGKCEAQLTFDSRMLAGCGSNCYNCDENAANLFCYSCFSGFYRAADQKNCLPCRTNCDSCNSGSTCSVCKSGYFLYSGACYGSCPSGTFVVSGNKCQDCQTNCDVCSDASTCTTCSRKYYLSAGTCGACQTNCDVCSDASTCTTCSSGYYLSAGTCEACPTNCDVCSDSSTCITCLSGKVLLAGQCVQSCPAGTYVDTAVCYDCPIGCTLCSSPSACTACKTGYYRSGGQCISCLSGCDTCLDSLTCSLCSTGLVLYENQCLSNCPLGTFLQNNVCYDCPTNCSICSDASTCTTCFSGYFLAQSGLCQACSIYCDSCSNSTTCYGCSNGFYLYEAKCNATCPVVTFPSNSTGACENCPLHCSSCTSKKSCKTCEEGYRLSNALCTLIPSPSSSQQAQQKATQAVSSAVTGAGSVLCVGSPTFPITALVSQIVQNTRYLNLTVTTELAEIYQTWGTNMISWEVPNTLSKYDDFKTSPLLFSQYGLGSSFMTNFWPTFMTIMVGLGVLIVSFVVRILLEKGQYRGRFFTVVQRLVAGSFNFVIVQVYGCLDDILFDLVLDMKTNPFNTFFSWTSLFCAVGFLAIGCSLVYMNMRVVYKYQTVKAEGLAKNDTRAMEIFNENNKYWELFYSEFNDEDFWSQSSLALFIIRGTLSSLTIAVLYDYPMMQTSFLVILDGFVLLFVIIKKPFTALRGKLAQYYFEIITLLVHICTFILALQDTFPTPSDTLRGVLCTSILYLNTTLVTGGISFMAIEIYDIIRMKAETNKYKKQQDMDNNIEDEKTQQSNQTSITLTKTEIEMQRSPNRTKIQPVGTLETSNLFSENNNTSLSGMMMLKPVRTLDLSMNADDSGLQDIEVGNEDNKQRANQNRSPQVTRPRNRTTTSKKQQQQVLDGLLLRNPTRHLRDLKKPEGIN